MRLRFGGRPGGQSAAAWRVAAIAVPVAAAGLWASSLPAGAVDVPGSPNLVLPTPTGVPIGLPTPTPSAVPSPSLAVPALPVPPPPVPGGTALPAPGEPAAPAAAPAPPVAAPAPVAATPAPGAVVADSLLAHLTFADPFLGAQVSAILASPVASQQPDLRHLSFVSAGPARPAGERSAPSAAGPLQPVTRANPFAVLLLLAAAVLAGLLVCAASPLPAARRWRASLRGAGRTGRGGQAVGARPRLRWLAAAALPVVAAAAGLVGVHQLTRPGPPRLALTGSPRTVTVPASTVADLDIRTGTAPPAAPQTEGPAAPAAAAPPAAPLPKAVTVTPAPPAELVDLRAIEERIAATHTRLAAAESRVAQVAAAPLSVKNPAGQAQSVRTIVADREEAVAAYNTALASEYSFYRSVASDSGRSTALVAAIQALGRPDLRESVVYDLQVVRTQLAEERALAAVAASSPATGASIAAPAGVPGSGLSLPLNGVLTQGFGPSTLGLEAPRVYQGVFYAHFHTGCDFAAPLDTPVTAAAPGVVVFAGQSLNSSGQLVGYGNYVVVAHANGYQTLYGHLDRILVQAGQVVGAGQAVGLEGSTGWSTGPHTHFELRHLGEAVDPMPFLTGQPLS
ncbi:MAG: hypothetical protein NVSMB29_16380 [Candidatus Dormibacteria bacterium]